MPRFQLAVRVDVDLLQRVNARACELGQTRSVFVERALERALSEAVGIVPREQAAPGPVGSPEPVRAAAPSSSFVYVGHRPTCTCAMCKPPKGQR